MEEKQKRIDVLGCHVQIHRSETPNASSTDALLMTDWPPLQHGDLTNVFFWSFT